MLNSLEGFRLQRSSSNVNLQSNGRVIKRCDFETILMFPTAVALQRIPLEQLIKRMGQLAGPPPSGGMFASGIEPVLAPGTTSFNAFQKHLHAGYGLWRTTDTCI